MGKLTQYLDYLNRPSANLSHDEIVTKYTHIEITYGLKKLRKRLKWFKNRSRK